MGTAPPFLNGWSRAVEVDGGRIEVTLTNPDAPPRIVEILMTTRAWENTVTVRWGDFDLAAREVRKAVLGLRDRERFLVYGQYELVPSEAPNLPVDPDDIRLDELARWHPEGLGRWVVRDGDGNMVDELRPHPD